MENFINKILTLCPVGTSPNKVVAAWNAMLGAFPTEKLKLIEELMARLERLRPDKILERKAGEAENLNKSLKFRAMPAPINII